MGIASTQNIDNALVNQWLQKRLDRGVGGVGEAGTSGVPELSSWLSPYLSNGTLDMSKVPQIAAAIRKNDPSGAANVEGGWTPGGTFAGAPINSVQNGEVNFDSTAGGFDFGNVLLAAAAAAITGGAASAAFGGGAAAAGAAGAAEFGGLTASQMASLSSAYGYGGAASAGAGALGAGVGGIDAGSLSQIMGNGGYMSAAEAAAAAGIGGGLDQLPLEMIDVMGGTEGAMAATAGEAANSGSTWLERLMNPSMFPSPASAGLSGASALSNLFGNGSGGGAADWARILGTAGAGLYGAKVAGDQTQAYKEQAEKLAGYGAPYRQRLSDLYANPSEFLGSQEVQKPVQMGSDIMARSLSTQGNPTGSGNALQQLQSYSADQLFGRLGQEKDRLGGFGGLSGYNAAAPSAANAAIQSMSGAPNVLSAAASDIFNPKPTYAQSMQQFKTLFGG